MSEPAKSTAKMRYCCNCGAELGVWESKYYDAMDTCGARECDRAVSDALEQERAEAHEQLDRDLGYW